MIIFGNGEHAREIARKAGHSFDQSVDYVISRATPQLLGGVIYTNYTFRTVQAHIAGFHPRWMCPMLMWVINDFPFNFLKVEKILVTVPSTNPRSRKIAEKMGFSFVVKVPEVVVDGDMDVLSLSRADCKYLKLGWRYAAMENAA